MYKEPRLYWENQDRTMEKEPTQDVAGLHPAIISEEIFHRANDVLEGRRRSMKFHDDKSDLYPLKGFLMCPEHNKSLTAYACQSHTGKLHHYYLCCKDKCKHRYRIQRQRVRSSYSLSLSLFFSTPNGRKLQQVYIEFYTGS